MDDEESESSQDNDTDAVEHLPNKAVLAEQIEQDQKESYRPASIVEFDLPQSFRALRPSSLPAPSHIRPPLRLQNPREHDPSFTSRKPPVKQGSLINKSSDTSEDSTQDEELQPNQKRLLDLVAANTPSHRGAWDSNSRAWKAFNRSGKRVESDEESDSSLDDALDQKTGGMFLHLKKSSLTNIGDFCRHYRYKLEATRLCRVITHTHGTGITAKTKCCILSPI